MYSQFGHQFRMLGKKKETTLGKGAIWSVIEKQLFRPRVLLMCAMDREKVLSLNAKAHIPGESGIDPTRLKVVTGPPTVFEAFKPGETAAPTDEYWKGRRARQRGQQLVQEKPR